MTEKLWAAVDAYIGSWLVPGEEVLQAALGEAKAAQLPAIHVAPNHGKLLMLLGKLMSARRILEIGTLAGYSTIWLSRGLSENGRLITLEIDRRHAEIARANFARAGLGDVIDLRIGPALSSLARLSAEGEGPFDLIFIDADKPNSAAYFEWAVRLSRDGSLIVIDNVVRGGAIINDAERGADLAGIRRLYEAMARNPRVTATAIQTVGQKGYDGLALALVSADALKPAGSPTAAMPPRPTA